MDRDGSPSPEGAFINSFVTESHVQLLPVSFSPLETWLPQPTSRVIPST